MSCRGGVPSIVALFEEANRRAPRRSRASDGICASAQHTKQNPTSDHEPDQRGFAHAGDLTYDPEHGIDCVTLFRQLRERRDSRIRYVIFHGHYYLGPWSDGVQHGKRQPWIVKPYTGPNPHDKHMHVSVGYDHSPETTTTPWFEEDDMTKDELLDALGSAEGQKALRAAVAHVLRVAVGPDDGKTPASQYFNELKADVKEIKAKV